MGAPDHQVGAHFEAPDKGVLVASMRSTGFFSLFQYSLSVVNLYFRECRCKEINVKTKYMQYCMSRQNLKENQFKKVWAQLMKLF